MFDLGLDFVNAIHIKTAFFAQVFSGLFGHDTHLGHFLQRKCLDLQPDAETVVLFKDGGHFGAGVSRDHVVFSSI